MQDASAQDEARQARNQTLLRPELIVIDGEPEYVVESVEKIRYNKKRRIYEYLTRWAGYDELSWEPAEALRDTEATGRFHARYPSEPNPYPD